MSANRIEIGTINSPELVFVIDASDNLALEDADGNTIIRFNQDQTTDFFADLVDGPNSSVIYDQSAEELTADVNNSSTATEELTTPLIGARMTKSSSQSLTADTVTTVTWDGATELNSSAPAFADAGNNGVTIPNSDYTHAKIYVGLRFTEQEDIKRIEPLVGGSGVEGLGRVFDASISARMYTDAFGPIEISDSDTITLDVRTVQASEIEQSSNDTYLTVVAQ